MEKICHAHCEYHAQVEILKSHFDRACFELRAAWLLCKANGIEQVPKEIADTILDLEASSVKCQQALKGE